MNGSAVLLHRDPLCGCHGAVGSVNHSPPSRGEHNAWRRRESVGLTTSETRGAQDLRRTFVLVVARVDVVSGPRYERRHAADSGCETTLAAGERGGSRYPTPSTRASSHGLRKAPRGSSRLIRPMKSGTRSYRAPSVAAPARKSLPQ